MTTRKTDLLQGTLDMLVLKVVAGEPLHGYAIAREIRRISNDVLQVQQGSLYPALHKLEKKRWLKAEWRATETGREAKYYALTAKGRQQLAAEQDHWNRLSEAVGLILREAD
jgi:PadR family transcriptional regulator PadR